MFVHVEVARNIKSAAEKTNKIILELNNNKNQIMKYILIKLKKLYFFR